jgi:uncharacterized NAD(P)/FAD-binding protein YdhS
MSQVGASSENQLRSIAIVGAGFSGTMLAVHLLELGDAPLRIFLFDRAAAFGQGTAYSTTNAKHLLNVRAQDMSAYDPVRDHFVRWLDARGAGPADPQAFMSRGVYGAYLRETFDAARHKALPRASVCEVDSEVVDLVPVGDGFALTTADGKRFEVDAAVLCVGNFAPFPPFDAACAAHDSARYLANPWQRAAYDRVRPDESVVIIGSGLTMVDVVLELQSRHHRGPLTAISRHGFLPLSHRTTEPYPDYLGGHPLPDTARALVRRVRREVAEAARRGQDWRGVVNALRPHTQALWRALSPTERRRFLRHVRARWEIHRHRIAPAMAEEVEALRRSGQLKIVAGRMIAVDAHDDAFTVRFRPRGTDKVETVRGTWLINCTGPQIAYDVTCDPLVKSLLASGLARPDPLRLGFDVTDDYRLVGKTGTPATSLFAIGPPIKGNLWETTAVPDIRKECEALARQIMDDLWTLET